MPPLVLVDISYLAYRAWYTMGGLEYGGKPTGIIYGVLEQIRRICQHPRIASNRVMAFFDSRQSVRRRFFPGYKKPRHQQERTKEEWADFLALKRQVEVLREEVLPEVGIPYWRQTGFEADDGMAMAAAQLNEQKSDVTVRGVISSADEDLIQCISHHVHLFNPGKEEYLVWGDIVQQKGITPPQWAWVKCLAGCSSDTVPGIPGVGEKTALEYLTGQLSPESKKFKAIMSTEAQSTINRNGVIVCLPHHRTKPVVLTDPSYDGGRGFFRVCERLGFKSCLVGPRRSDWEKLFAGKMPYMESKARKRRVLG